VTVVLEALALPTTCATKAQAFTVADAGAHCTDHSPPMVAPQEFPAAVTVPVAVTFVNAPVLGVVPPIGPGTAGLKELLPQAVLALASNPPVPACTQLPGVNPESVTAGVVTLVPNTPTAALKVPVVFCVGIVTGAGALSASMKSPPT
jgi:hypothetical protein